MESRDPSCSSCALLFLFLFFFLVFTSRFALFVFIDAFKDVIHLLLQKQLKFLNHKLVNRALAHKGRDKALYSISFVYDNTLEAIVCHIDIHK